MVTLPYNLASILDNYLSNKISMVWNSTEISNDQFVWKGSKCRSVATIQPTSFGGDTSSLTSVVVGDKLVFTLSSNKHNLERPDKFVKILE